jgi:hypothetical protein
MDSPATDYLRHRMQTFARVTDETIRHFSDPCAGTGSASAPYRERCRIPALLDSLPDGPEHAALREEYLRITQMLGEFVRSGPGYRELLLCDLRYYTHEYHAAVCHASLGSTGLVRDQSRRDLIGELCNELGDYYDLTDIVALIAMIDNNLPPASDLLEDTRERTAVSPGSRPTADDEFPCARKKTGHAHSE